MNCPTHGCEMISHGFFLSCPICNQENAPNIIMEIASSNQVGGSHYKDLPVQPAEFSQRNKLGFLEGCIVKRVCRHKAKGGREDLLKARHEIDLLLEIEYPEP